MGERIDRAQAMIEVLPETGAIIIVPRADIGCWLMQGIQELRSREIAKRCRVVTIQHHADCVKLSGLRAHVIIDDTFVRSNVRAEVKAYVDRLVAGIIRVMQPA